MHPHALTDTHTRTNSCTPQAHRGSFVLTYLITTVLYTHVTILQCDGYFTMTLSSDTKFYNTSTQSRNAFITCSLPNCVSCLARRASTLEALQALQVLTHAESVATLVHESTSVTIEISIRRHDVLYCFFFFDWSKRHIHRGRASWPRFINGQADSNGRSKRRRFDAKRTDDSSISRRMDVPATARGWLGPLRPAHH